MTKTIKRQRGGASLPCPCCSSPTNVLTTRRHGDDVVRRRRCDHCKHVFQTTEKK